jgi:hypothetical protein
VSSGQREDETETRGTAGAKRVESKGVEKGETPTPGVLEKSPQMVEKEGLRFLSREKEAASV